jgi:hypothetical protein
MNIRELLIQSCVTFIAASLGAVVGAFLARRTERFKHFQELRSAAYVDFLRGFAKVALAQSDSLRDSRSHHEEVEGGIIVTESKARIAIYGSGDVVRALSNFIDLGTQTRSPEGMEAFAELCSLMRGEAAKERASLDDIRRVLFS